MGSTGLIGEKFGYLIVLKSEGYRISPSGRKNPAWLCQCVCGNKKVILEKKLKEGRTKSCGCKQHFHEFNEMREEAGTLFIKVGDKEVLIDKEDLDKIYPNRVFISESGYAKCRSHERIHRLIIKCPEGLEIDHINRNRLDNRKSNLRIVTHSENMKNRDIRRKGMVAE